MRSSKQRQRNKQNRQVRPSGGNVVNRVFDSSGPEGKVRGTPAQIIEKYAQLHRDAQLGGDRVAAENFAQHAEHYTRMLAEAQRDIDRVRDEQDQWNRERQAERDRQMEQSRERQGAEARGHEGRNHEGRGHEARSGDGRGEGRSDVRDGSRDGARDGQRSFEPRPERSFEGHRDRDRQPRFRGRDEAPFAPPTVDAMPEQAPSEPRPDERAPVVERRDDAREHQARDGREDGRGQAPEPSFLRQPLFPILVAEPEDDRAVEEAGPALVETPESRAERLPEPRRRGPRRQPRSDAASDARPAHEPRAADGQELALAEPSSPEATEPAADAQPRAPRARRPRKPRAEGSAGLDVAPDAAE